MKVGVVGGGIVGLAVAWECSRRGHAVTVYDPAPGSGASHAAAGMLAPVSEASFGEEPLTALLIDSAAQWPAFASTLADVAGRALGHDMVGTLQVGLTADDVAQLTRLWRHQAGLGARVIALEAAELRAREPRLHPRARGVFVAADHQVDPRRVIAALLGLLTVSRIRVDALADVDADVVVLAAGCASARLADLPVRPVQGVLLRLHAPAGRTPALRHVIRGLADGQPVYLVPRADGEVLVGATVEERADGIASAGAVRDLLGAAIALVPTLAEHAVVETTVGQRPATPDNGPIVGVLAPGVLVATGHFRHGVVAAPSTAHAIAELIDGHPLPSLWAPFGPARFERGRVS